MGSSSFYGRFLNDAIEKASLPDADRLALEKLANDLLRFGFIAYDDRFVCLNNFGEAGNVLIKSVRHNTAPGDGMSQEHSNSTRVYRKGNTVIAAKRPR